MSVAAASSDRSMGRHSSGKSLGLSMALQRSLRGAGVRDLALRVARSWASLRR